MPGPLLEVKDLKVSFRTEDGIVHAVDGISYTIETGKTLGIVGESGSGKSVAALTMLGLTRPQGALVQGRMMFEGNDLIAMKEAAGRNKDKLMATEYRTLADEIRRTLR